jgi:DNA-binding NarL/FixJ family response regulator
MSLKKHKVVIVEDHTLLSQAIAGVVNNFEQFEVSYLCKNGQELIDKLSALKNNVPDIILMDVNMPVMNGIEATKWLSENHPSIYVLALSVEDDEPTILKMIRAGAKGYLLKDVEKSILEEALSELMLIGFYHTKQVSKLLVKSLSGKNNEVVLKENELRFMKLACTELTYKAIADQMCLSPKTIDGYRDALFEKLNVKNRVGLAVYAIKNKIYTP